MAVLAIFIVGMTLSVAFAEPAHAKKYKIEQPHPSYFFLRMSLKLAN